MCSGKYTHRRECLSRGNKNLVKYLSSPQTIDIVYEKIIERVQSDKKVDVQGIKLIKTYLTKHVPSRNTLINLDQFCQSLSTTSTTELAKSAIYVRQNIAKLIGDNDAAKKPSKSQQNSSAEESPTAIAAASGSGLSNQ